MFKKLKSFFGVKCDDREYDLFEHITEAAADRDEAVKNYKYLLGQYKKNLEEYDLLKRRYEGVLDEYENLSKKYFALKTGIPNVLPTVRDEFAPKCARKNIETCSYFRLRSEDYLPALSKFLRHSGNWTLDADPDIRIGHSAESGEKLAWYSNEKFVRVEIPFGSVLLIFDEAPKTAWLVVPESEFGKEWVAL